MEQDRHKGLRRERVDVVRRMQASILAVDPMLDAMCENLTDAMGADAAVMFLLLEREMVFLGAYGMRDSPKIMPRPYGDHVLDVDMFEELRMDENPAMAHDPMVHGPYDAFRSVAGALVRHEGAVVGGLSVMTRSHRAAPYDAEARAALFRGRDAVQAHLQFGVLIRTKAA